jgi:ATP-dependent Zn protease
VFGANSITSGASSDLEQATRTARAMVEKFGMSELGPWTISSEKGEVSGETRSASDKAVQRLTQEAYNRSKQLLVANRAVLDKVAAALLEHETLTGEEIKLLAQVAAPISIPPALQRSKR